MTGRQDGDVPSLGSSVHATCMCCACSVRFSGRYVPLCVYGQYVCGYGAERAARRGALRGGKGGLDWDWGCGLVAG